jgi:hypothetical protein
MRDIRLRDLPSYVRTTDPDDVIFKFTIDAVENASKASGVVILTFDDLEQEVLDALSPMHVSSLVCHWPSAISSQSLTQ